MRKKIAIFANSTVGLVSFRRELLVSLVKDYDLYIHVPDNERLKELSQINPNIFITVSQYNSRGKNPFSDFALLREYKKYLKDIEPNVLLTYTIKPNIYGTIAAQQFHIHTIINVTGLGSGILTSRLKFIIKQLYKHAMLQASHVFFQNEYNCNYFKKFITKYGVSYSILPGSGVNLDKYFFKLRNTKIRNFGYAGRLMDEKGSNELFEAFDSIYKIDKTFQLYIAGPEPIEQYKQYITRPYCKYLGNLKDMNQFYNRIDCLVHPSHHEGMSNVLLEASASGIPTIASNIPGCIEITENEFNGYTFNVGDSKSLRNKIMTILHDDKKTIKIYSMNARKKVESEFDRNIIINSYKNLIKRRLRG